MKSFFRNICVFSILAASCPFAHTLSAQLKAGWHNTETDPAAAARWASSLESQRSPVETELSMPLALPSTGSSSSPSDADRITTEIQTLANGLQNDAGRIFEYCRNHINFEAYWGCKKGATLTYLEGSGNAFDTSALMVSLLKASGYQDVEYRYGFIDLNDYEVQDWLGTASISGFADPFPEYPTDQDFTNQFGSPPSGLSVKTFRHFLWDITYLLAQGYPGFSPASDGGDNYYLGIPHVWVRFRDTDGTVYEMDPSYKNRDNFVDNLNTEALSKSGFLKNDFLNAIGGIKGSNYIQNINEAILVSKLEQYTGSILTWFKDQKTNADRSEFIYDMRPVQIDRGRSLAANDINPYYYFGNAWLPLTTWTVIPEKWMTKLEITFGKNYDEGTDTFTSIYASGIVNMASLAGRKFSLIFNGNTATTYFDETVYHTFGLTDPSVDIRFKIDHPFGEYDRNTGVWTDAGKNDQIEGKTYKKNDNYAYTFIYGFDPSGRHLRKRQSVLETYKQRGIADTDWRARTEMLNTMGLTWLHQFNLAHSIIESQSKVLRLNMHTFGRMAQEEGFYVDVGLSTSGSHSYNSDTAKRTNSFHASTVFGSALEHALIEQMQGLDKQATSTVKIMQLANEQGTRVYQATPSNWSSVRSTLSSNGYLVADLDRIESYLTDQNSEDQFALVPADPTISLNQWSGTGYATLSDKAAGMYISGGFNGGYLSTPSDVSYDPIQDFLYGDSGFYDTAGLDLNYAHEAVTTPKVFGLDPVDMASGAFTLDKEDLQCGLPIPRGLSFSRHYNSNRNTDKEKGLGFGWTHNLHITALERSAVRTSMGEANIRQMTPYFTGIQIATNLLDGHSTAKEAQAAMLVAKWATDQLLYKGVSITMGNKTIEFVRMPDGSYEPPAGLSMTLTKEATGYRLEQRHGNIYNFNNDGQISTIVDQHGNTATFTYSSGKLTSVTDSYNRRFNFTWTGDKITKVTETTGSLTRDISLAYTGDVMTSFTDPENKTYLYQYNSDNRITHLRDPDNRIIIRNEFDDLGRVKHQYPQDDASKQWSLFFSGYSNIEQDPQGGEKCFLFDDRGRSVGIINQNGDANLRSYDGEDHIVSTTTPKGETTTHAFNGDNNVTSETDPLGHSITYTYDSQKRLKTVTDKRGNTTSFTYTLAHLLETVTDPLDHVTTYGYYPNGLVYTVTDAESKVTTTAYDSYGAVNRVTLHDGTAETFTNNPRGDILTSMDAENRTTTNTWNDRRQLLTKTAPAIPGQPNAVVTKTYDDSGNLETITDANGNTVTHTWNSIGKPLTLTQPALPAGSNTISSNYDSRDWLENTINSLGYTIAREYDSAQRITALIDPLNRRSENTYDANGQILTSKDPLLRIKQYSYNDRGEMDIETNPADEKTRYLYDKNGNRTRLTNRRGKIYGFKFDAANRLESSVTPSGKTTSITYFDNNQVKTVQEPSGQTTTYAYNDRNLVSSKADPTGTIEYLYDDSGLLETVTEGSDTITRTYDERGRVKTYTNEDGDLLQYRYDGNGNLTKLTYPDDKEVTYTYNKRNLLATVTDWSGRVTTYNYDPLGRLTGISRPNGTATAIERDAGDQILSIKESKNGILFSMLKFNYDKGGQVFSRFHLPVPSHSFTHPTFAGTYDDDNRLLTVNSASIVHDDDGNMTTGPIKATSGNVTLGYNSRNQLISADGVSYTYDAEGHRRTMTDSNGTTRFTIDANANMSRLLVRHNLDGTKTFFVYGLGLLYEADETGNTKNYHFDQVGSTVARTDDQGQVIGRAEYSPYGLITMQTGDMDTPFRYNGYYGVMTEPNGLLYMRARYYSPELRRFINADPIGFAGGMNWYQYANNSPLMYVDASGHFAIIGAIIGGAVDLGAQIFIEGRSLGEVNFASVAGSAALGATGVGLSQVAARTIAKTTLSAAGRVTARTVANAGIGGGLSAANTAIRNQFRSEAEQQSVARSAAIGFTFGGLGSLAGEGVTAGFSAVTQTRTTGLATRLLYSGQLELSKGSSFPAIGQAVGTAASGIVSSSPNFFRAPISSQSSSFNSFGSSNQLGVSNSFK